MSLSSLARCCPTWAEFRPIGGREAHVDVVAVRASRTFTRLFELRVVHLGGSFSVFERVVGGTLPVCCPERHINPDGSFCTGLRAGEGITDETATAWWDKLHAFALCQETAEETGFWPSEAQLSHGEAGELELAAENAAEQLGLRAVYREAVAFDTGRIAMGVDKIDAKTGSSETAGPHASAGAPMGEGGSSCGGIVTGPVSVVRSFSNIGDAPWWMNSGERSAAK